MESFSTAIISDLHLCEAEPLDPKKPLWKKFKRREFFFDDEFRLFLSWLEEQNKNSFIELILNGDVFDFDSLTHLPENPDFSMSWLEKSRGLFPQEAKSVWKMRRIIEDHPDWFSALAEFYKKGHRVVFIIGNHDLELSFPKVQQEIRKILNATEDADFLRLRFCEWFYISQETLVEHSHQYDPYCLCQNPVSPFIRKHGTIEVRLPFGNLASRYMMNGMGYFNPHVDSNYIMTLYEYLRFFFKYLLWTQPLIIWTWFWGAVMTMFQSLEDRLLASIKNPLELNRRIREIALKSNATPEMVWGLRELAAHPAASNPFLIAQELWLDRAFIMIVGFFGVFQLFTFINMITSVSFFWMFIPLLLLVPFFIFYMKSIKSSVSLYKEPDPAILKDSAELTGTQRVVYGHNHHAAHVFLNGIEHLNSGTWSPAFRDIECKQPIGRQTFVWITPQTSGMRKAELFEFLRGKAAKIEVKPIK